MASYPKSIFNDIVYNRTSVDELLIGCMGGFSTYHACLFIRGESAAKVRQMLHYLSDKGILSKRTIGINSIHWQTTDVHKAFVSYKVRNKNGNIADFIDCELPKLLTPTPQQ